MEQPWQFALLAGIGLTSRVFDLVRAPLEARGSVAPARFYPGESLEEQAANLVEDTPRGTVLIGHSFGGYLALEALRRAPNRLRGVVLINSSARPETALNARFRAGQIQAAQEGRLIEQSAQRFASLVHPSRANDADLRGCFLDMTADAGPDDFIRLSRASMTRPDARPWLGSVDCPVLVIAGADDRLTPPVRSEEIAAAIPRAELHVIARCGHLAPLETPAEVTRIMSAWLDEIDRPAA